MATQTVTSQESEREPTLVPRAVSSRIAFRFVVLYSGLYCFFTQILVGLIALPNVDWVPTDLSRVPPMRWLVLWTAAHVFHVATPPSYADTGSGDTMFHWISLFCLLVMALVGTVLWIAIDRTFERQNGVAKWFRLGIRICLAGQMITYGIVKAVPLQMPFPNLSRLIEPYGNLSPMGVLWASIGSAPAYEMFAGCAELLAGILLLFPRTTTLGALICLADMVQVFMLNMTYDVPVKLLSFHLILLSLVLLAPDLSRLRRFFFLNRVTQPSVQTKLFATRRANRIAVTVQVIVAVWLLAANVYGANWMWRTYGGGSPKSALYGLWNVEQLTTDGQTRLPLLTDNDRWRRAVFEYPTSMGFERMDGSMARYGATINPQEHTLVLSKDDEKNWKGNFNFQREKEGHLILDGMMGGHPTHIELRLADSNKFLLVSRGFHWIQEVPFNR